MDEATGIPEDDGPGRAVGRRKTKTQRLIEAQQILELHVAGVEDVYLCERFAISRATLYRRIREALDAVVDPTVEEYRAEATVRIRAARRRIADELGKRTRWLVDPDTGEEVKVYGPGPTDVASLLGRLAQLEELEARLRGGFAPTKVDVRHRVATAFDTLLEELEQHANDPAQDEEETHAD